MPGLGQEIFVWVHSSEELELPDKPLQTSVVQISSSSHMLLTFVTQVLGPAQVTVKQGFRLEHKSVPDTHPCAGSQVGVIHSLPVS
jgi:hypothetical protein